MRTSKHHEELGPDGKGKCSVPMWMNGCPAGFCDKDAYGKRPPGEEFRTSSGLVIRMDGKYSGIIPGLACPGHGGPKPDVEEKDMLIEDTLLHRRLREAGLTEMQALRVIEAIEATCPHCKDADVGCQCWNDE